MKRVYREVRVAPAGDGWRILLDARDLQTPARGPLLLPWRRLAEAISAEWDAQAENVVPATMPLMRLAATAIDRTAVQRGQVIDEIVGYAQTDLVCYRAERPPELAGRDRELEQFEERQRQDLAHFENALRERGAGFRRQLEQSSGGAKSLEHAR